MKAPASPIAGFPCPDGKGIFVWLSNQPDKNCRNCGKPLSEHVARAA